jgi:hypothetical protein
MIPPVPDLVIALTLMVAVLLGIAANRWWTRRARALLGYEPEHSGTDSI